MITLKIRVVPANCIHPDQIKQIVLQSETELNVSIGSKVVLGTSDGDAVPPVSRWDRSSRAFTNCRTFARTCGPNTNDAIQLFSIFPLRDKIYQVLDLLFPSFRAKSF